MTSVGEKMAVGAAWMIFFRLLDQGIGLISTLILVRILIPDDFGVVALATSFIALLELLNSFGFDMALIQNQNAERDDYDTAWTFNVVFGVVSAVLLAAIAPAASEFYSEPRIEAVMYFLAVGMLLSGFDNIGIVAFRKEMMFGKEFSFLIGKRLAGFCVTIALVFVLKSYWALVAGMLARKSYGLCASYILHPYRPRLSFAAARKLFNFSKWLLISNVLYFLRLRSADFVIARIAGVAALGMYTVAFEIANMATTALISPINRAVFPGYSKLNDGPKALSHHVLLVVSVVAMVVLPAGMGMAAVADIVVPTVLGSKWMEAIPLIKILAIYGAITALQANVMYVYLAIGKPRMATWLTGFFVVLSLPLLVYFTAQEGVIGAAKAYLIACIVALPVYYFDVCRRMGIGLNDLIRALWRIVAATLLMFLVVVEFVEWIGIGGSNIRMLCILLGAVALGGFLYAASLYGLWLLDRSGNAESILFQKIGRYIRGKIARSSVN